MLSPQFFCEDLTGCQGITLNTTQNIWHSYLRIFVITCRHKTFSDFSDFSDGILSKIDVCMLFCLTSTLKNQIELDYFISNLLFPMRTLKTPGVKKVCIWGEGGVSLTKDMDGGIFCALDNSKTCTIFCSSPHLPKKFFLSWISYFHPKLTQRTFIFSHFLDELWKWINYMFCFVLRWLFEKANGSGWIR